MSVLLDVPIFIYPLCKQKTKQKIKDPDLQHCNIITKDYVLDMFVTEKVEKLSYAQCDTVIEHVQYICFNST